MRIFSWKHGFDNLKIDECLYDTEETYHQRTWFSLEWWLVVWKWITLTYNAWWLLVQQRPLRGAIVDAHSSEPFELLYEGHSLWGTGLQGSAYPKGEIIWRSIIMLTITNSVWYDILDMTRSYHNVLSNLMTYSYPFCIYYSNINRWYHYPLINIYQ